MFGFCEVLMKTYLPCTSAMDLRPCGRTTPGGHYNPRRRRPLQCELLCYIVTCSFSFFHASLNYARYAYRRGLSSFLPNLTFTAECIKLDDSAGQLLYSYIKIQLTSLYHPVQRRIC